MHRRASLSLETAAAAAMTVDDDVDASDDTTRINPRAIDRRVIVPGGWSDDDDAVSARP